MGNLGETKPINKIIIEYGGDDYVFEGGGGQLAPNSVGTEELKDGAVEMQDLHDDVKSKIQKTYDEDDETLHMDFEEADVNNSNQDAGQGGGEDEDLDDLPGGGFDDPMLEEEGD